MFKTITNKNGVNIDIIPPNEEFGEFSLKDNDIILFKASHGMHFEKLIDAFGKESDN